MHLDLIFYTGGIMNTYYLYDIPLFDYESKEDLYHITKWHIKKFKRYSGVSFVGDKVSLHKTICDIGPYRLYCRDKTIELNYLVELVKRLERRKSWLIKLLRPFILERK